MSPSDIHLSGMTRGQIADVTKRTLKKIIKHRNKLKVHQDYLREIQKNCSHPGIYKTFSVYKGSINLCPDCLYEEEVNWASKGLTP